MRNVLRRNGKHDTERRRDITIAKDAFKKENFVRNRDKSVELLLKSSHHLRQ